MVPLAELSEVLAEVPPESAPGGILKESHENVLPSFRFFIRDERVAHLKQSLEGRMLLGILDEGKGEVRDQLLLVAERRPLAVQKLLDLVKALRRRGQAIANLSAAVRILLLL